MEVKEKEPQPFSEESGQHCFEYVEKFDWQPFSEEMERNSLSEKNML